MAERDRAIDDVLAKFDRNHADIERLAGSLDGEALRAAPASGGWSIGQVLGHLYRTSELYMPKLELGLEKLRSESRPAGELRNGLFVRKMLLPLLASKRKLKAPGKFVIEHPEDDIVARLLEIEGKFRAALAEHRAQPIERVKVANPISGLIRMNLWDIFCVIPTHTRRHVDQIERIAKG